MSMGYNLKSFEFRTYFEHYIPRLTKAVEQESEPEEVKSVVESGNSDVNSGVQILHGEGATPSDPDGMLNIPDDDLDLLDGHMDLLQESMDLPETPEIIQQLDIEDMNHEKNLQ